MAGIEVQAVAKNVRMTPRKVRLVAAAVKGKPLEQALALLRFMPQRASVPILKATKSAAANAENNYDMDPEDLWIKAIYADDGPSFRRFKAKARGRVGRIIRRNTHLTVIAEERRS